MPKEIEKYLYIGGAALIGLIVIILLCILISKAIKNSKNKKIEIKDNFKIDKADSDSAITEKISTQKLLNQNDETALLRKSEENGLSSDETTLLFRIEKEITYIHTDEIIK